MVTPETTTPAMRAAEAVKVAMQARDLSEKALAERTGIPRTTLRRHLTGLTSGFSVGDLGLIAAALRVDVTTLLGNAA